MILWVENGTALEGTGRQTPSKIRAKHLPVWVSLEAGKRNFSKEQKHCKMLIVYFSATEP